MRSPRVPILSSKQDVSSLLSARAVVFQTVRAFLINYAPLDTALYILS